MKIMLNSPNRSINLRKLANRCRSYFGTGYTIKQVDVCDKSGWVGVTALRRETKTLVHFGVCDCMDGTVMFSSMEPMN